MVCIYMCVCMYAVSSLATVNRAAKDTGVQVSLFTLIYTPLDMRPRVVWQGHKVGLVSVFCRTSTLISTVVALVYIPKSL
jgi:hypothetical protein